jgi:hypothetical protein
MATLGGMIGPMMEAHAVTIAANPRGYPCRTMLGISMDPTAAQSARATPVTPAKNMLATMVTWANPPLRWPTMLSARSIRPGSTPARTIISPAMMKKGIAIRAKESMPPNIIVGRMLND